MPYLLIGRKHNFLGRRLWEIAGRLKNFGAGRMVVRSRDERYSEPSFYRIIMAQPFFDTGRPHMDEDNMKGKVLVERVFRGKNMGVEDISKTAYKTDFRLIHKHEEAKYLQLFEEFTPPQVKILPSTIEMPPLLKLISEREGHAESVLKVQPVKTNWNIRVAEEGEQPTQEFSEGLGTPVSPHLYQGVL